MSDGTRTLLVPVEESQGTHYHVPGGCGGHLVQKVEATAEEIVTERGLRPCSAAGCTAVGVPRPERCNGCGKPVFDPVNEWGTADYCTECADYLRENPNEHGHRQYRLREDTDA